LKKLQQKFSSQKFCFSRYQSVYKNCNPKSELEGACDPIRSREDLVKLIVGPFLHAWNELGFNEFGRGPRLPVWKKLSPKLEQLVVEWFASKMLSDEVAPSFLQLDGRSLLQLDGPSFLQMDAGESSHRPEGHVPGGELHRPEPPGSESSSSSSLDSESSISDSGSPPRSPLSADDHSPPDSPDDHSPPDSPDDRSPSNSPDFSQSPNEEVDNDGSAIGTAQERVQQHGSAENFQELEAPEIHATDGRQANRVFI
jgi:hypothetical protein